MRVFFTFRKANFLILSIFAMLVIWQLAAWLIGREIILPTPLATFDSLLSIITRDGFPAIIGNTLRRVFISFVLAFIPAVSLGIVAGFRRKVYDFLHPPVLVVRAIPIISIILLAIIWLKADSAPILAGFIMIFPMLYFNTVEGARAIDPKLLEMARLYEIRRSVLIRKLYLPAIRQYLLAGTLAAASMNLKTVIAAEVFSQPRLSIGTSFQIARVNLNTPELFAWAVIVIFMASLFDIPLKLFGNIWKHRIIYSRVYVALHRQP